MKATFTEQVDISNSGCFAAAVGGTEILLHPRKLALICSQKCPGDVILKTYDFARLVRGSGLAIVSGFHSPIEKDCLPILLRGPDPIIIVQAHRLRLPGCRRNGKRPLRPSACCSSPLMSSPPAGSSIRDRCCRATVGDRRYNRGPAQHGEARYRRTRRRTQPLCRRNL
jgi:hypothetical protein